VTDEDFGSFRAFEWDENKRRANVIKHGIDFDDAKEVFYDPAAFTFPVAAHCRRAAIRDGRLDARCACRGDIHPSWPRHSHYLGAAGTAQ
jgi:Ribonuclease toxin, BrnT, of type II toxin-antitoxin system